MHRIPARLITSLHTLLSEAGRVSIAVHQHPDGDALGSSCALSSFLKERYGIEPAVLVPDDYPDSLDFITEGTTVINAKSELDKAKEWIEGSRIVFSLDHPAFGRTGDLEPLLVNATCPKVLVDHHQNPDVRNYDLIFSDIEVSSTCELLYYVLLRLPDTGSAARLPKDCARNLMTGMTTDTNNFANSVFPTTLKMASDLLSAGVDRDYILDMLYHSCRLQRLKAMACYLGEKLRIVEGQLAYVVFDRETTARLGLKDGETEGFVNLPLSMKEVNYSVFLRQDGDVFRVSVRSKKGYSAASFAKAYFNGGGHENAAGGRLPLSEGLASAEEVENYIKESAARFLRSQERPQ